MSLRPKVLLSMLLALALVFTGVLSGYSFQPASAALKSGGDPLVDLPGTVPTDQGAPIIGTVRAGEIASSEVAVVLRPRNQAQFEALVKAVQDPASPLYRHFLTPEQLVSQFAPDSATLASVRSYFTGKGLSVVYQSSDNFVLTVNGTQSQLDAAFNTTSAYRQNAKGEKGRINLTPLRLPASVAANVQSVTGYDTLHRYQTALELGKAGKIKPRSATANTPNGLRTAYNISGTGLDGSGTVVALTLWGAPSTTELQAWATYYGHPLNLTIIGNQTPASDGIRAEANLDVELAQTAAYNAAIRYYVGTGPFDGGLIAVISQAINDNVDSVSNSWGECEASTTASARSAYHTVFSTALLKGIPVFFSSGDSGVFECNDTTQPGQAGFPPSDDLVTSVGGTTLDHNPVTNAWNGETAWSCSTTDGTNDSTCFQSVSGSTGGGVSLFIPRPDYQKLVTIPVEPKLTVPAANARVQPDLSMDADPATGIPLFLNAPEYGCTVVNPACTTGGTSASSPLMAGVTALAAQKLRGKTGALNPFIYSQPATATWLYDVNSGYNGVNAHTGWDYTTGRGSLKDVNAFVNAIYGLGGRAYLSAAGVKASDAAANNNGIVEPGENISLKVGLTNTGAVTATNVSTSLKLLSGPATLTGNIAAYGNIAPGTTVTNTTAYTFSVNNGQTCGNNLSFEQGVTYSNNLTYTYDFVVPVGLEIPSTPVTHTYSGPALAIPDGDPNGITSTLAVTQTGKVGKVTVTLNATHPNDPDLIFILQSPSGRQVTLVGQEGSGTSTTTNFANFTNTTLDDDAPNYLGNNTAPFTGSFKPEEPLSSFRGEPISGNWLLISYDLASGNTGTLDNWTLRIAPQTLICAPVLTALSPNSIAAGSSAFTLTVTGSNFSPASVVYWNGSSRATTYQSPTQLTAAITAGDVANAGTVPVTVTNGALGSNSLNFVVTQAGCGTSLVVTKLTDDGSCGTLRSAIVAASSAPTKTITFAGSTPLTITLNSGLTVGNGITIKGSCGANGPTVNLVGTGVQGNGLTLTGANLNGLWIKGFAGRQLVALSGHNTLTCVKVSQQ